MDFDEIKSKDVPVLKALIHEKANELRELRFKLQNQQLKTVNKISDVRTTIARIKTVLAAKIKAPK